MPTNTHLGFPPKSNEPAISSLFSPPANEDDSTDSEDDETADSSHIPAPTRLAPDPSPISDHLPAPPAPSATSSSSDSDPVSEAAVASDEPPNVASD